MLRGSAFLLRCWGNSRFYELRCVSFQVMLQQRLKRLLALELFSSSLFQIFIKIISYVWYALYKGYTEILKSFDYVKTYGGFELGLHTFLFSVLDGGEWLGSHPHRSKVSGRDPCNLLKGSSREFQSRSGRSAKENYPFLLPKIYPEFVCSAGLNVVTTLTEPFRLL